MSFSQFYTATDHFSIIPAVMLALFGCAILLFDFMIFPDPRQRKWLLIFVALAEAFTGYGLWTAACLAVLHRLPGADRLRRLRHGGRLRHLLQLDLPGRRAAGGDGVLQVPGDRRRAPRRILRADPVRPVRHVLSGHRHGPGHAVHRPGADGAVLLRDGGLPAHRQALQRGRHEVSAAGRLFHRLPGLRLLGDVRHGRLHQAGRYPHGDRSRARRGTRWFSWRWPPPRWGCSSRSPRRPSTCGRRTPTKARPPP